MTEKQKQRFLIQYQKRFKRNRNFAHPKLLHSEQAELQSPVEQEQKQVEPIQQEIKHEEESVKRSPSLTKSLLHDSPEYEAQALQLFQQRFKGRDRYLRGLGPITGISLLRNSQYSPRRSGTLQDNTEIEQRFSYKRQSILDGRNLRSSQTPSQNLIQNLLNEYLPLNNGNQELRLSAQRKSTFSHSQRISSFDNGETPLKSNKQDLKYFEHRPQKLDIIPLAHNGTLLDKEEFDEFSTKGQYGVTQYTNGDLPSEHRLTPDNINEEIDKVLEEEQELKESARQYLDNQSGWGGASSFKDNESELQIIEDDNALTSLKEGGLMNEYLKHSSIAQE